MKAFTKSALVILALSTVSMQAVPVCHRCEEIRADNALHHKNYEYYDEYLKANKGQINSTPTQEAPVNTQKNAASKNTNNPEAADVENAKPIKPISSKE